MHRVHRSYDIEPILASRLIPLNKGKSEVRPIGVGEVLRRIIGKCVTKVLKQDIVESSDSLQVCAGQKSGSEAAVHAVYNLFQHEQTDAVMLVDASNAFNSVNRAAALHNIRVLCPTLAPFVINTYRLPARLSVAGGKELVSAEGTTQGDPLAMSMYALSLQPLISRLQAATQVNQCWFADDATGCGSLDDVRQWGNGKRMPTVSLQASGAHCREEGRIILNNRVLDPCKSFVRYFKICPSVSTWFKEPKASTCKYI
ncbi:predicted protein [Nematostella vectensis]|uniref:Reverse transcriptase domain-containing protein n=1 Tax=Nematostella vectensis TaxID=45351 RepID=A7TBN1_NEMVE|nr:predicted protein [Nematostella vectensis]|eukprot:XP_001618674.1 hypothetical protein NEMVEDRAFT_v1g224911 [Nematostella vectensis]